MSKFLDLTGLTYYDGKIKQYINTKIPAPPSIDGAYNLQCAVIDGVVTYFWGSGTDAPPADGQSF